MSNVCRMYLLFLQKEQSQQNVTVTGNLYTF